MTDSTSPKETVETIHKLFKLSPKMVNYTGEKGGTLHYAISKLKSPKIVAYLLCRGQNVTIEGIDCSTLDPIDLSLQNSAGENALELAEIELLKSSMHTDIDDAVATKIINDFINLAKLGHFEEIAHKMEHYQATYNTEKNILLAHPRETDIAKEATNSRVKFDEEQIVSDVEKNTMPHYPSFDKEWKKQDNQNTRSAFINAYRDNDFPQMERAISKYKIKFKGSDTVSELAYEAINHNCLNMAYELVKQGSASQNYIPEGETVTLQDKYNIKKAQIAADGQVKTGLNIKGLTPNKIL